MKAVIEMKKKTIEVLGKDLTVDSNMFTGEVYVTDRADDRRVFSGYKPLVISVYIINNTDDVITGYLSTIEADGGDAE